ncbi:MAG TPA: hypothetical protein VKE74_15870, partial [Gemmataceae bacterium]|nr:hypothetical protein [Gemmataceae bacterium]
RFRSQQLAERAVEQSYHDADPGWAGGGPWAASEVVVLSAPPVPAGQALRELARRALPVAGLPVADGRDELTVYREFPAVPMSALPHFGPAGVAAYQAMPEIHQCSPHSRLDVARWLDPDAE